MTDPQLRIEVAKRLGWTHCEVRNGQPLGFEPGAMARLVSIPDYPGDPREWAVLLEAMQGAPSVRWVHAGLDARNGLVEIGMMGAADDIGPIYAPTLGRAVCEAWSDWHDATGGEGE